MGVPTLIERLTNRHHHILAWKICEYLKLSGDRVLVHWACAKVKSPGTDAEISNMIVKKLINVPGISFAEIASTAYNAGRVELATRVKFNFLNYITLTKSFPKKKVIRL